MFSFKTAVLVIFAAESLTLFAATKSKGHAYSEVFAVVDETPKMFSAVKSLYYSKIK